jgi:hypothetical protein
LRNRSNALGSGFSDSSLIHRQYATGSSELLVGIVPSWTSYQSQYFPPIVTSSFSFGRSELTRDRIGDVQTATFIADISGASRHSAARTH